MTNNRQAPIEISKEEFKKIGYRLVDTIAGFIHSMNERPVTPGESPKQLQKIWSMVKGQTQIPSGWLRIFRKWRDPLLLVFLKT